MRSKLPLIASAILLMGLAAWLTSGTKAERPQVRVDRVKPFDDSILSDSRDRVTAALPQLQEYLTRLKTIHSKLKQLGKKVPAELRRQHAAQMKDIEGHLENAGVWLRALHQEPLSALFLSGALALPLARTSTLRWASVLAPFDASVNDFLLGEIRGVQESEDPVNDLQAVLGEVAIIRENQVRLLRELARR